MDQSRCQALCQFKGHAAVVVRTVPVAHLWRIQRLSVLCEILEPTAMRLIYKMRFYVSPVFQGNIEERLVARQLPCVDTTDDGFTLWPPRQSPVHTFRRLLIEHGTIGVKSLL